MAIIAVTVGIVVVAVGTIFVAVTFIRSEGHGAFIPHLTLYALGDRGTLVADVRWQLSGVLCSDSVFAVTWGLALIGCALFYLKHASTELNRHIAKFVLGAAGIAVAADWFENYLVWWALPHPPDQGSLHTAIAATAVVKCCAICIALVGVPASAGIVVQWMIGACQAWRWKRSGQSSTERWWEGALAASAEPKLEGTKAAIKAASETQQSWLRAYDVPGVDKALASGRELRALSLSGGGVRSACVAFGAMDTFSKPAVDNPSAPALFDKLDYVVSVSGGGYAAGARLLGVQAEQAGAHRSPNEAPITERFEEGSAEFDHVRRGSSYIADSPLDLVRALGQVFKNLLESLATVLLVPVIAGLAAGLLLAYFPIGAFVAIAAPDPDCKPKSTCRSYTEFQRILENTPDHFRSLAPQPAAYWAVGFFALLAVLLTLAAVVIEWIWDNRRSERVRGWVSDTARGSAGFAVILFTLTIALPGLMSLCDGAAHPDSGAGSAFAATLSGLVGLNYVAALVTMVSRNKDKLPQGAGRKTSPGFLKRALPPAIVSMMLVIATLAALMVVWLALLGSFAAGAFANSTKAGHGPHLAGIPHVGWWTSGLLLSIVFLGLADVTSMSLHPFYRRRLARTFSVRRDEKSPYSAVPYLPREPTWLHRYGWVDRGGVAKAGPKFVFACAATITGAGKPAPGLNAVSYVLSADYIGGPDLGWFHTEKLYDASPPRIRRDLTVQAAVAVSGAAFASSMGRQDKGFEKLLAISGARLGTWLPNPYFVNKLKQGTRSGGERFRGAKALPSIRGAGYLYREILGINNIDAQLVQITDGGHYDNSGLVEALRRRCQFIVVIDGGGDLPPLARGLTDALRLAKYELGVDIALRRTGPYSMQNISPGSGAQFAKDDALACLNKRVTAGAVVAGTISYPAAAGLRTSTGTLIFAKAVVSQNCPYWLLTYAAANEIFPHDPTSDQWFSEGQFAAYTALGRIIAAEVLDCFKYLQTEGCHRSG